MRRTVEQTVFQHADVRIPVTISSGAAVLDDAVRVRPEALAEAADRALYAAKKT